MGADNGECGGVRVIRTTLLAIVVALTLAAGLVSTANADDKTAFLAHPSANANTLDPGDPGLPPD